MIYLPSGSGTYNLTGRVYDLGLEDPPNSDPMISPPTIAHLGGRTAPTAGGGFNTPTQSIRSSAPPVKSNYDD